jgi:hypothetical protein
MECAVHQYEIQPPEISWSWSKKAGVFFAVGFFMFSFRWIIESFFHWEHQPIMEALILPVALGAYFAFRPVSRWFLQSGWSLIIGDDFIESRVQARWFRYKKRVCREQIKSISEGQRGLRVMDRGKLGPWMLGFILVPATMPEYQEIRSELAEWAPIREES